MGNLQTQLNRWRQHNFPEANATQQLLGVGEEVGELMHAHLKQMQKIRGDDDLHIAEARDAVGDLIIYLYGYCSIRGWDMDEIVRETADHVMKRDWIADPVAGGSNVS